MISPGNIIFFSIPIRIQGLFRPLGSCPGSPDMKISLIQQIKRHKLKNIKINKLDDFNSMFQNKSLQHLKKKNIIIYTNFSRKIYDYLCELYILTNL